MPKTITITGDSIPLPKRLAKKWQGRDVLLKEEEGALVILPEPPRSLRELLPLLREAGKRITRRDLDEAVRWARAKTNEELKGKRQQTRR